MSHQSFAYFHNSHIKDWIVIFILEVMQIKVVKVHDEKQAVFITTAYKQHPSLNEEEGSTLRWLEQ